jgi:hypothetical protein
VDFPSDNEDTGPLYEIPPLDVPVNVPNDFQCSICMEAGREDVVIHPCKLHLFHYECLAGWLRRHPDCPLCRRVRILINNI